MKIAIIVRRLNVRGGTQRYAVRLSEELQAIGHDVTLYTYVLNRETCYSEALHGLRVVTLADELNGAVDRRPTALFRGFSSLMREERLARELASKIDSETQILNPHDQDVFRVAYYFKRSVRNIPSVWTMNDMPTRYASYLRARGVNPEIGVGALKRAKWFLFDFYLIHRFIKRQDAITVLDRRDAEWVSKFFGSRAEVVRTGADVEGGVSIKREPPHSRVILLTTGIFFPHRRFEDIVKAVSRLRHDGRDIEFRIVGDGSSDPAYAERIRSRASELGVTDRIMFLGRVTDAELAREYANAHVFVFAAHMQSWGIAVFEAMSTGLPAVVSRSAGASEVLTDGENALLVAPMDPDGIARAISMLLDDPNLYKRISQSAATFARSTITWRRTAGEMERIYMSLLNSPVSGQSVLTS